jgi:DNA-binding MarR family transcriptional regulator
MSPHDSVAQASGAHEADDASRLAAIAQEEYANRRRRDRIFGSGVFAEPAWDMLLDLYVQEHLGRAVSIQSLCVAASVPPTTALRWIGRLIDRGLLLRTPSRHDNRVVHVGLTADGRAGMEQYLRGRLRANGAGA